MLLATPDIILTAAVTILAALICLGTAILVARTRGKHKVSPPAMTGSLAVECALRVQGNTVEQVVIFLPLLWVAALYFHAIGWLVPLIGFCWCVGRILYAAGYMSSPGRREPGFVISVLSSIVLAILGVIGLVQAWAVATAV
jgi:glutathione S-transferase